ncbi:hypothetical protein [Desulfosarcina variabilis]|uniref:hypothetical protein n=1 Tax=Desulfosarcina variabilis TaxID=2300 RepID=UPI003AFAC9E5
MKIHKHNSIVSHFVDRRIRVEFNFKGKTYQLANHHDRDGGTSYWWAIRHKSGRWRVFDIRALWSELGISMNRDKWYEDMKSAMISGDRYATNFVADHLSNIGIAPVLAAKFS